MADDVVPEEVKIVSGPFLPLCQYWFPLAELHVSDFPEECALALKPLLTGIFIQPVLVTKLVPYSLPLGYILVVYQPPVVEILIVTQKVHYLLFLLSSE